MPKPFYDLTITSPGEKEPLPRTFVATGTYNSVLPEVKYFPDYNAATYVLGITSKVVDNVWKSYFKDAPVTVNDGDGKITADNKQVTGLSVSEKPKLVVISPQPGESVNATFPVIGTFDKTVSMTVRTSLEITDQITKLPTTITEPTYQNEGHFACVLHGIPTGEHNNIIVTLDNTDPLIKVTIGEIKITN